MILMHNPESAFAFGSKTFVVNQGLLHTLQAGIIGPRIPGLDVDVAICTSDFPVAVFSGPIQKIANLGPAEEEPPLIARLYR